MTNKKYAHIALVIDRSGSMSTIKEDMNKGLAEFLTETAKSFKGNILVDVVTFDTIVEKLFTDTPIADVKGEFVKPRGGTALNDALGKTIVELGEKFARLSENERPGRVLVMVVTDGEENSSREYKTAQIKTMVTEQTKKYGWNFLFLGANIDSFAVGGGYGIQGGSTLNYVATASGVNNMTRSSVAYASAYFGGNDGVTVADSTDQDTIKLNVFTKKVTTTKK